LGPKRQLTATSRGNATGTVGVEVVVGGGVLDGTEVDVGALVGKACVAEGATAKVGVSVRGAFDGRLQADTAKIRVKASNKRWNFIALSFCCPLSYAEILKMAIAPQIWTPLVQSQKDLSSRAAPDQKVFWNFVLT
jgi:hypothetical protein